MEDQYQKAKDVKEILKKRYFDKKNEDGSANPEYDENVHGLGVSRKGKQFDGDYYVNMSVLELKDEYPKEMDGIEIVVRQSPMASYQSI